MSKMNKINILIAEDSPTQATQIKHLLESHHYKVSVARDGKKAMDWLTKHKTALVISDIMMPEMSGYELCKQIKSNKTTSHIPVILLTRLSDAEEIIEGLSCGADSFITKPFNEDHLLSNIEKFLSEGNREDQKKVPFGVQIFYKGEKRLIQAEQQNVINLMLSIYEGAIHQNERLIQTQEELRLLNERLESLVEDRTSDLTAEIKLSNQITNKLKESEEKWRTLVTTIPDYIGLVDCKGKFLFLNHYAEGFSEKDTIGKSHLDFIPNECKEFYQEKFEKCISTQKNQIFEYTAFGDNYAIRTYETCLVPIIQQGKVSNVMAIAMDITERKQAEETIRILARFPSENPDPVLRIDLNGRLLYANEASYKLLTWKLLIGEKTPADLQKIITEAMNGGIAKTINTEHNQRVISFNIAPVVEAGYANLYGRDITVRKRAEEALRESEEKYRRIFENVTDVFYETSIDGTILEVSPSIRILSRGQYSRDELMGKSMYEFYSDPNERATLMLQLKERGNVSDFEIILKNRDGSHIPCSISSRICFDAQGRPEKIIGSLRDITEHKRAEDMLRESEMRYKALFSNAAEGILVAKIETTQFLYANPAICKMFGYTEEELLRLGVKDIHPKESLDYVRAEFETQMRGEKILVSDLPCLRKDGTLFYADIRSTLIVLDGIKCNVGFFIDITERKLAEKELINARDKAEESDRLKTAFLHNISHEIRTPMNAIVGFSALLGEPDIDLQTQQSYIETIMQSSNHLLSIITDIVDISNIEANIVKIARNEINVNFTLNSVFNQFLLKAEEKKIKLVCETKLSDSEALIITDNTKLTQILTNLISNALKFTDKGFIKAEYKVKENFLEFCISDTGIGIPQEFYNKIFDRFYQVQNIISRIYEGTGLGLAISKAYVELMGGKIWLSSEPGKGTSFYFTIPYERQTIAPLPVIENPVDKGFVFTGKKTILVAEDIDSNFKLLTYFLSGSNIEILRAMNGKEAFEKCLSNRQIDLVLMDIKMPEMDGYTAVKLIRDANITIPIVAQTAYSDDREMAIARGCNGFISKPFDKKNLIKVLSEFI